MGRGDTVALKDEVGSDQDIVHLNHNKFATLLCGHDRSGYLHIAKVLCIRSLNLRGEGGKLRLAWHVR